MIKTINQVPSNYSIRSRDFQLLARVFDNVFNSSKTYSDLIRYNTISKNTDRTLLDLISKTIGFDVKREYDENDLYTLCNTFKSIIKNKGTLQSVEDCVRVLLKSQNISKSFAVKELKDINNKKLYEIQVLIPVELTDIALLEDMLDYVLPAGYIYSIITISGTSNPLVEEVAGIEDYISKTYHLSADLGHILGNSVVADDSHKTELSAVYTTEEREREDN